MTEAGPDTLKNNGWLTGPEILRKDEVYWLRMIDISCIDHEDDDPEDYAKQVKCKRDVTNEFIAYLSSSRKLKVQIC